MMQAVESKWQGVPFTRELSQVQSLSRPPLRRHRQGIDNQTEKRPSRAAFADFGATTYPAQFSEHQQNTEPPDVRNPCGQIQHERKWKWKT